MNIKLEDLDALKLVGDENFAPDVDAVATIEGACVQGSQGWGVSNEIAVILTMARNLRDALKLAVLTEEASRQLKGEQLARGRVQKQYEACNVANVALVKSNVALEKLLKEREQQIESMGDEIESLNAHIEDGKCVSPE